MAELKLEKTDYPNIFKREDGKYIACINYGYMDVYDKKKKAMVHKQKRTRKVCSTLKEARNLISQNDLEKADNKNKNKKDGLALKFREAHESYLDYYKKDWTAEHLRTRKSQGVHMLEFFGKRKIKDINTIDIEEYFSYLKNEKELSVTTIKHHKTQLNGEFKYFKKQRWIKENPVTDSDIPSRDEDDYFEDDVFDLETMMIMLNQALSEEDKSIVVLFIFAGICGMRAGEILGLKYKDLEYTKDRIFVHNNRTRKAGGGYIEKLPKFNKTRYTCFPKIAQELLELPKLQQEMLMGRKVDGEDYVYQTPYSIMCNTLPAVGHCSTRWRQFFTRANKRLRNKKVDEIREIEGFNKSYVIKKEEREKLLEKYKYEQIPYLRFHGMRHSMDTILLDGQVNYLSVAACLGHAIQETLTTSRYYHPQNAVPAVNDFWDESVKYDKKTNEMKIIKQNEN